MRNQTGWIFTILAMTIPQTAGCGGLQETAKDIAQVTYTIAELDPAMRKVYEASQLVCLALPDDKQDKCIADVRATWAPLIDTLQKIRGFECKINPDAEGCNAQ